MKQQSKKKTLMEREILIGRVSLTQKALFAKHLSIMLKAGLPITEALSIAQDSAVGKLKKTLGKILKSVEAGKSLSESFGRYPKVFSDFFVKSVYTGEKSGTLVENLENIAEQLEKEKNLISKIKGAMLYPIIILATVFVLGMVLAFLVLPKITPLFEGLKIDLPFTTRALIWFSHFIQDYSFYLFFGIIAFLIFMTWLLRQKFIKPVTHWLFLNTPILKNIVRKANLARFCRTLAMLLKSGVNIDEALKIIRDTMGNYYYRSAIAKVSESIRKGTKLSENLSQFSNIFPIMLTRMVKVGEESGKFEETLFYLANLYEVEVDNSVKTLSTIIEPVLLIVIGLTVGFLALSIITPIYDITGGIKR